MIVADSTLEVAQIAGTTFAGVAALAACAAVLIALREARLARQPLLRIQPIVDSSSRHYGAFVINAGDGVASGVHFVVADHATLIAGPVLHGFLRPGEGVEVLSSSPVVEADQPGVVGFVIGRDRFGFVHDWTTTEAHRVNFKRGLATGLRKHPTYSKVNPRLHQWFPDHPDPKSLVQVPIETQKRLPPS